MPLACNARRRASMTPKLGGGAQQQPPSYESMMEAAEPTGAPAQAPATTTMRVSSKNQRFGVTPYGAAAPLDGGPTPAERKAALLKKRQSLAVMSRFSHTGGRGVTYSGSGTGNDEENRPPMAGGAAEAGARGPLKPRAASVNVVSAAVNTNIVKPTTGAYIGRYVFNKQRIDRFEVCIHTCASLFTPPHIHTGIYAAAEQQAAQAQGQPQLDPKQASALLKYLRATVNRAEQVGKRLQVLAQAQRGTGGIRPSQVSGLRRGGERAGWGCLYVYGGSPWLIECSPSFRSWTHIHTYIDIHTLTQRNDTTGGPLPLFAAAGSQCRGPGRAGHALSPRALPPAGRRGGVRGAGARAAGGCEGGAAGRGAEGVAAIGGGGGGRGGGRGGGA